MHNIDCCERHFRTEELLLDSLFQLLRFTFNIKLQIEAIVQDITGQGCISNIDALNIRLDSQVRQLFIAYSIFQFLVICNS